MSKHKGMEPAFNYLEGTKCCKLTLLKSKGGYGEGGLKYWFCACDCGNFCKILDSSLKNGRTKSCGCMRMHPTKSSIPTKQMDKTEQALHDQKRKQILKKRERIKKQMAENEANLGVESSLFAFSDPLVFDRIPEAQKVIVDKSIPNSDILALIKKNGRMTLREIHRARGNENDYEIYHTRHMIERIEDKSLIKEGDRRRCTISNKVAVTYVLVDKTNNCSGILAMIAKYNENKGPFHANRNI
jgi:hypothetical protein